MDLERTKRGWPPRFDSARRQLLKALLGTLVASSSADRASGADGPRHAQVAIVGAGLFGASTAMHLAARSVPSVLLIGPAENAASTSAAQKLASHYDESRNATAMDADPMWAELARSSIDPLRALERRTGTRIFAEVGSLRVTQGELAGGYFDLDGIRKTADQLGVDLVELDASSLAARYPEANFDGGSIGLLQERNAGVIHPRRLVSGLRKVALEDGATWIEDEVVQIDPGPDHVELLLASGAQVRARLIVVATGAAPIGHALLTGETAVGLKTHAHRPIHIEVPDDFESTVPPLMITSADGDGIFGGFVAPPLRYPDGHRYIKVAGQSFSRSDGQATSDAVTAAIRATKRLFPKLEPGAAHSRICMTTDSANGRPIIDWVDDRVAVAIAGNGRGAKAAIEIGRRAADLVLSRA